MVEGLERAKPVTTPANLGGENHEARLEMIYEINRTVGAVTRLPQMLEQVIRMTQQTLNASAASVLLFRNNNQELFFEAASGPVGQVLRQVKLSTQYGIAGQVARTGKPLIVNDVARSANFHKMIDDTTGFITKSLVCAPLSVNRQILGVIEVLNKRDGSVFNENDLGMVVSVATTVAMAIDNTRLHQKMLEAYKDTIFAVASVVDAKDHYARGHSRRVMEYSVRAGTVLCLGAEELETLEYAGMLHDIGKISIDATILNKPGPLSHDEWKVIYTHPTIGAELLMEIPFLEKASELVLYHHEHYNGKGYPNGFKGEEIPLGARLLSVAEAFDAMTTAHAYRTALSIDEAAAELHKCSGSQFCPIAVKAFISGLRLNFYKQ
jgi:HD-GYP domain-containing protein (c-di-GMP phosphodiesterase class II)